MGAELVGGVVLGGVVLGGVVVGGVVVGALVVGWTVVGWTDGGTVVGGTVTTLAPDELGLAEVPVSEAVAGLPTWRADWDGLPTFPVGVDGGELEVSRSAIIAATQHAATAAPPAMSLLLVNGELAGRSDSGSWSSRSS